MSDTQDPYKYIEKVSWQERDVPVLRITCAQNALDIQAKQYEARIKELEDALHCCANGECDECSFSYENDDPFGDTSPCCGFVGVEG